MPIRNTADRFGALAKTFHWLTLALLIGSLSIAFSMAELPLSPRKLQLYSWHKWVGVTIFMVVILRLCWRLADPPPPLPADMSRPQRLAAGLSHLGLYTLLIATPLVGWVMSAAHNLPVVYLGLVPLPSPFGVDSVLAETLEDVHGVMGKTLMWLVVLHMTAALYHHFIRRDDVLVRMLPWRARRRDGA